MTSYKRQEKGSRIPGIKDSSARHRTPRILESMNPIRFFRDTSGQVLLFGAVLVLAILAFLLAMPNATRVTTQKVRAQTSADVGAFSGSIWLARSLNLTSSLNIGIRSVYTWMTVLTVGEAMAQALQADSHDVSVRTIGQGITSALFGSSNPVTVSYTEYPAAIAKLDTTAQWLYTLQGDLATSFSSVAATLGSQEASRNMGVYPSTQTAGGYAIVRTNDSVPLLVANTVGDSMLYADLLRLGPALDTIPTMDPNIGPATGRIIIDPTTWEIRAYYGDSSNWCDVRQRLKRFYKKAVIQEFRNKSTGVIDSAIQYSGPGGGTYTSYVQGDSWAKWILRCQESGTHTPFIWPNGEPNSPYKNTAAWTLVKCSPTNNKYKMDTCWVKRLRVLKSSVAYSYWNVGKWEPGDSILPGVTDSGFEVESSFAYPTDFYTGAESTVGHKGARVRPRRVNPERAFHTVSYVWQRGASSSPYGMSPPLGRTLFPRNAVAPASPLFAVAQAVPFLPGGVTDFFFEPGWDVRLTALDSVGVADITSDTAFASHTQGSFDNLEDLRKYVLLP
jgi:hypothetical protein